MCVSGDREGQEAPGEDHRAAEVKLGRLVLCSACPTQHPLTHTPSLGRSHPERVGHSSQPSPLLPRYTESGF